MSRAVLDSSPMRTELNAGIAVPRPRPLKRSASTASLPTPPQTVEQTSRYARSRSRGSDRNSDYGSDSEEIGDAFGGTSTSARRLCFGRKRQRTERLDAVLASLSGEDSENPFWDGTTMNEETNKHRSSSPPAAQSRGKALISPPPSRRQTAINLKPPAPITLDAGDAMEDEPIRDSPNNPFLDDSPMSVSGGPVEPQTPTGHMEKPTISYVFRGVKTTFANPLYNLPPEVHERSLLPVDHPDYSPDPVCPPKLLFADARRRKRPSSPTRKSGTRNGHAKPAHHADDEWEDSDEEQLHVTPPKRLFRES